MSPLLGRKVLDLYFDPISCDPISNSGTVLVDPASGNPVLTITQKPLSLHKEFRIFAGDSDSEQLVTVRGKFKLFGSPEMMVHFRNRSDGKEMELHIKGEFFRRNATISCEGRTIATIKNKILNSGELFFDQQTYFLTVAPRGKVFSRFVRAYSTLTAPI